MIHVGELKEELIQYAKEIGVDKIRFASADTFDSLKDRLILHESLGYLSGFEEPDIEKRTNPSLLLPKVQINCCDSARVSFQNERCSSKYKGCKKRDLLPGFLGNGLSCCAEKSSICSRNSCEANILIYGQNQWWIQGNCLIVQ